MKKFDAHHHHLHNFRIGFDRDVPRIYPMHLLKTFAYLISLQIFPSQDLNLRLRRQLNQVIIDSTPDEGGLCLPGRFRSGFSNGGLGRPRKGSLRRTPELCQVISVVLTGPRMVSESLEDASEPTATGNCDASGNSSWLI